MEKYTYTGFVKFTQPQGVVIEEIDVEASSQAEARKLVQAELDQHFSPGGVIRKVERRTGLFW